MASDELLDGYLNDHLGGSTIVINLAEQSRRRNEGSSLGTYLATLIHEIEEDRETLATVMQRLGIDVDQIKEVGGQLAEKAARVKFQMPVGAADDVSRLLEVESILVGIFGKQMLWQMLGRLSASEPRLSEFDFESLTTRAQDQIAALNGYRMGALVEVFG